jgi:hypothetical protein
MGLYENEFNRLDKKKLNESKNMIHPSFNEHKSFVHSANNTSYSNHDCLKIHNHFLNHIWEGTL